jgi:hypothetical protein
MLNDKWSKYRAEQKDYENAYNKLQELIKASNSLTPAPLTHRNNDFISLGKDTNVEIIRYQSNDLVTTNPESIKLATQILKEVKQNTSLTYKELTDVLNTACSLTIPSESQKTSEHAEATLAYLHRLNTADSKRFYGLLMALAGVALIAASIALTVFTFGGALPLVLAIIPIAHPLIAVGVVAVTGAALGAVDIKTGLKKREEAESDLIEADSIKLKADFIKFSLISKPITEKLSNQLELGYLDKNIDVQDRLAKKQNFSRVFNHIEFSSDINKEVYESLTQSGEKGLLQPHLQAIAKNMSRAFLDENHNLKPNIKKSLKLNASQKEENQAIDELLKSAVTLYLLAASAHYATITSKKTNESNEVFSHIISNPANLFNTTSGISKQSLFEISKPDEKLLITNIAEFDAEIARLMRFVQATDIEANQKNKIEEVLKKSGEEIEAKIDPCRVEIQQLGGDSYMIDIKMPEKQKNELESMIPIQLSSEINHLHAWLVDEKNCRKEEIDKFEKTKPENDDENPEGPGLNTP